MRLIILLAVIAVVGLGGRPKIKDHTGVALIDMAEVGYSCVDSSTGYAIVDGSLEKCDNFTSLVKGGQAEKAYEEYKCRHLRVRGQMKDGKCVCKEEFKGPICAEFEGCPDDRPVLFNHDCLKANCANDGIMAIGTAIMECICKNQWDGRCCERLSCWRLTDRGHDKRYRNVPATKTCECGVHFEGENCDIAKSCEKNGVLTNGVCVCSEGYGGETCERKCNVGRVTC